MSLIVEAMFEKGFNSISQTVTYFFLEGLMPGYHKKIQSKKEISLKSMQAINKKNKKIK